MTSLPFEIYGSNSRFLELYATHGDGVHDSREIIPPKGYDFGGVSEALLPLCGSQLHFVLERFGLGWGSGSGSKPGDGAGRGNRAPRTVRSESLRALKPPGA